jgi:hypothetical protein
MMKIRDWDVDAKLKCQAPRSDQLQVLARTDREDTLCHPLSKRWRRTLIALTKRVATRALVWIIHHHANRVNNKTKFNLNFLSLLDKPISYQWPIYSFTFSNGLQLWPGRPIRLWLRVLKLAWIWSARNCRFFVPWCAQHHARG